jgi:spore maturation protein SpmB
MGRKVHTFAQNEQETWLGYVGRPFGTLTMQRNDYAPTVALFIDNELIGVFNEVLLAQWKVSTGPIVIIDFDAIAHAARVRGAT